MPKKAKPGKDKKSKADKKSKKDKKGKEDKKVKEDKKEKLPEKPKFDPCAVECPIYYIFDVQKTQISDFFEQYTGAENDYLYFKKESVVMKLFEDVKQQRDEEQRKHDAIIDEIIMMYADPDDSG